MVREYLLTELAIIVTTLLREAGYHEAATPDERRKDLRGCRLARRATL